MAGHAIIALAAKCVILRTVLIRFVQLFYVVASFDTRPFV